MADKQKTRKEPLQNIPIQNSLLINFVRSFQSTLTLFGLYNDFKVQKSLKIFIRILRQRNTEMGMILYTDTEERIFQQKSHFRRMEKEVTTSQPQYLHFQESLIEQTKVLQKTNQIQEKVCNTQQLKIENLNSNRKYSILEKGEIKGISEEDQNGRNFQRRKEKWIKQKLVNL